MKTAFIAIAMPPLGTLLKPSVTEAIFALNFRFRWKSGHAADITAMTEFDPTATLAALADG